MKTYIGKDKDDMALKAAACAAEHIRKAIAERGEARIIVATGASQFEFLNALVNEPGIDWTKVTGFHLDEYVGLSVEHPASFRNYMRKRFVAKTPQPMKAFNEVNGEAADPQAECAEYEERIRKAGGIDLFMGGVGEDGHLAFNEPFSSLVSRTRVKSLTYDTILVNSRFFDGDISKVPTTALTVGVGTVMDAKEVLVLAFGHKKANALREAIEGAYSHKCTLSALQAHPHGIIVADELAVGELKVNTYRYFKDIEKNNI